jgi:hypothetical protein
MAKQGTVIIGNTVYINNKKLPPPPNCTGTYSNVTVIDGKVFINGYEWKNGKWKRTLRALWHMIF